MIPNQESLSERVFRELSNQLRQARIQITEIRQRSERAEIAGGVSASTLANAPTNAGTNTDGVSLLFISNARKVGEGVGAGTGTLCYFNPATGTWFRVADDTAAVT